MSWLAFLGPNGIFAILGLIAAAVGGAWLKGRLSGAEAEQDKQEEREQRADDIADEVQNDIGAMTPEQRREALRKWAR